MLSGLSCFCHNKLQKTNWTLLVAPPCFHQDTDSAQWFSRDFRHNIEPSKTPSWGVFFFFFKHFKMGGFVQNNWVSAKWTDSWQLLNHMTVYYSPAWMAEMDRRAPARTAVRRAELPISVKTRLAWALTVNIIRWRSCNNNATCLSMGCSHFGRQLRWCDWTAVWFKCADPILMASSLRS